jgi:nucleotide-binding universal stress UspA family protein
MKPPSFAKLSKEEEATMFKHVLVPTDGSARSRKAARAGIAFAKAVGARVTAYHGIEPAVPYVGDGMVIDGKLMATLEKYAREHGEKYVAEIANAARAAGVACETYVTKPFRPHEGIIAAAKRKKCDVIFIGSHGRGGVAALILGSVTQNVLAHSKIPVLVYR